MAQNTESSLSMLLEKLEKRYEISFTYLDKNIEGISFPPPEKDWSLEQSLHYLSEQSGLQFEQIDKRFVAISKAGKRKQQFTVCGFLKASENLQAVNQAFIYSDSAFTSSDQDGYFELSVTPGDILTIRHMGYKSLRLPVSRLEDCIPLILSPKTTTLKEITVSDYLTQGIRKHIDGSLSIQTEQAGILPGLSEPGVLQSVQSLPGIQSANESVANLQIRGGTNDQTLVLWDGIRMYQNGHFFGLITAFNPYLVEKVSLIKNGTSAEYSDGVSGTVDIRSQNQAAGQFSAGAGINLLSSNAFARIPLAENMSLHVAARRSLSDLWQSPTYKEYFKRAFTDTDLQNYDGQLAADHQFYFYDMSAQFMYEISEKDRLKLSVLHIKNDIRYREVNDKNDKISGLKQQSSAAGLSFERFWTPTVKTSAQAYVSSYVLDAINHDINNDQRLIQKNEMLDIGLKLNTRWIMNDRLDWLAGYQFSELGSGNLEDINKPDFRRYEKNVMYTHALFAEGNYSSQKTTLRAGLRGNYYQKLEQLSLEPRLAVHHRFMKYFAFELLGEIKTQSSSQVIDYQSDFLGIEKRRWLLADGGERPLLRSRQLSAALQFDHNHLLISAEAFRKRVEGITIASQGFQNQLQYVQANGRYDVSGIDFLVNKKFKAFSSWLSYTLADNHYYFSELSPNAFPNKLDITHTFGLGLSYTSGKLELAGGINWHSGRPFTEPQASNPLSGLQINYQAPNSSRLADYFRVDLSARYNFFLSKNLKAQLAASVWNLSARQNILNAYYRIGEYDDLVEVQRKGLSLTPNIMFKIYFNAD